MKTRNSLWSAHGLCFTALMAAIVCVTTMMIHIAIPLGYAHLGDAFILLAVYLLGKRPGCWAAAIGSSMADLLSGFPYWAVPTFIIKFGMAWIAAQLLFDAAGQCRLRSMRTFGGFVLATAWMVAGYVVAGALLYHSLVAGLSSAPGLAVKGVLNIAAAYAVCAALERTQIRALLLSKITGEYHG